MGRCPSRGDPDGTMKEKAMRISFGMYARPNSTRWSDIRRGPSLDAVREHINRVANFASLSRPETSGPAR